MIPIVFVMIWIERRRIPGGAYSNAGQDHHGVALGVLGSVNDRSSSHAHGMGDGGKSKGKALPKHYYNLKILPFISNLFVKIWFDRLKLMALFDRNRTFWENLLAILLAVGVACLGSFMLQREDYYQDLTVVLLCFVMASCQFSLLKSVQPDVSFKR